jgi:hypothetical protein
MVRLRRNRARPSSGLIRPTWAGQDPGAQPVDVAVDVALGALGQASSGMWVDPFRRATECSDNSAAVCV